MNHDAEALEYHALYPPGKISVTATKPCQTQHDLSLAYSPGVAAPCMAIYREPELVYRYTAKANLVAVISNGTAVLAWAYEIPLSLEKAASLARNASISAW